ncbi:MAG: lasso peptide biosynthesis PqqD family chaperone [Candidatus Brocadiaceae bacterium]|nr:lasso peptide biosynthesis PqqD family chaperone [Candidatus Brocadiaceae bacterium]
MSTVLLDSTIVRSSDQVSTDLGGEVVILGLQSQEYFGLEDVGVRIWEIIQEPKTVKEILDTLLNDYDVEPKRCESDLLAVLQEMTDEGLIEIKNETTR